MQHSSKDLPLLVDIYDEVGIGGGASGVAGGLLHPYSPKGLFAVRPCSDLIVVGVILCLNLQFFQHVSMFQKVLHSRE